MCTLTREAFQKTSGLRAGASEGQHAAESKGDGEIKNFLLEPQCVFYKHHSTPLHLCTF